MKVLVEWCIEDRSGDVVRSVRVCEFVRGYVCSLLTQPAAFEEETSAWLADLASCACWWMISSLSLLVPITTL